VKDKKILQNCVKLRRAFEAGLLGKMDMPEDAAPKFTKAQMEERLVYFTLPMSLNYQRNSYSLWEAATRAYRDKAAAKVFSVKKSALMPEEELRSILLKHKVALQPNKHVDTWKRLATVFHENWGSIGNFLEESDHDFRKIQQIIQKDLKPKFPYLSGPKIFHYWSFILTEYAGVNLKNRDFIEIAPDTHVVQSSVKLGVLDPAEAEALSRDEISLRWRNLLKNSEITPIDMHSPLWFWSRNSFQYKLSQ
jgi:hypothetical protein